MRTAPYFFAAFFAGAAAAFFAGAAAFFAGAAAAVFLAGAAFTAAFAGALAAGFLAGAFMGFILIQSTILGAGVSDAHISEQRIRHRIGLTRTLLEIPNIRQTDFSGDPYRQNR